VSKHRSRQPRGKAAAGEPEGHGAERSGYLDYVADLLTELEEIAEREGNRELAERLRHSRQAAERH